MHIEFQRRRGSITNADGSITLSGIVAAVDPVGTFAYQTGNGNRTVTTLAITLDVTKLSKPNPTITEGTDADGNPTQTETVSTKNLVMYDAGTDIGIGLNSNNAIVGLWGSNNGYYAAGTLPSSGMLTVIYSFCNAGTSIYYAPGDTYTNGSYWTNTNLKGTLGSIDTLTLSADAASAMTNMTVWAGQGATANNDLAREAIAVNKLIPEPTTATLSLLALAGLAMRRRRK